ncbi:MAG: DUF4178 domain-containing protein [Planctomycetes bacterium]|nr:DUF4178 domain-containing protein [Planctomycetota bacterium]
MNCPSCGAEITADRRYAHLVVCDYCQSAVILDEKAARVIGKMAALMLPAGPFYVGGSGRLAGKPFRVLGRVRHGYRNGFWDEWYLARDDGQTFWIGEDENNFTLEVPERGDTDGIQFAETQPGQMVTLRGEQYHVDEKDVAECEGGEGQLPFAIMSGERIPFLDLSSGERFATIEFELDGETQIFLGRRIDPNDIVMDIPRDEASRAADALPVERAGDGTHRERIVRSGQRVVSIKCQQCAAPLDVPRLGQSVVACPSCGDEIDLSLRRVECPQCQVTVTVRGGRDTKSATCPHCSTRMDISRSQPSAMAALVSSDRPRIPVEIGQEVTLRGTAYHVVGYVRYTEQEGSQVWQTDEFLLYSSETGYRWLILEDGHFSLSRELDERPHDVQPRSEPQKSRFTFLKHNWVVFETCHSKTQITWVEGELPWVAQIGDRNSYMDAISPPLLLSAEWTETEAEWYLAEYLSPQEVAESFGKTVDQLPARIGVAPNQPRRSTPFQRQSPWLMTVFAMIFLGLGISALTKRGEQIAGMTLSREDYTQEYLTEPFRIGRDQTLCRLELEGNVNNGWLQLDIALLNERDEALLDFTEGCSYYHGVEGGESWSEGSRSSSRTFRVDEAGTYRLLVLGESGAGGSHEVTLTLYEGTAIARYYLILFGMTLAWPIIAMLRTLAFEGRRWAPVLDDD